MAEQREVGDWILNQEIGSGSFARVWKATNKYSNNVAAVKEINVDRLSKKLQDSLTSEVAVLKHTKHHNIVCLLDLIKDHNRLYIVLEFCAGGDLGHYIKRYRQVSEAAARYFLRQLAEGLKELRRHNVIHRDLKPQNLLLSDSSSMPLLKIADFGFARSLAPQGLAETLCGSPLYMAPEILQFHKYDAKADLWSIGTILFELLVGKPPFNGANHMQLLRNIELNEAKLPDHVAARLSEPCKSLLTRLLQRNPVRRIGFEEFFTHPFLNEDAGATVGVPPSQPVSIGSPAVPAVLPAAMRQAMMAVTASAADRAVPASRPSLHKQAVLPSGQAQHGQCAPLQHQEQHCQTRQQQAPHLQPVVTASQQPPGQQEWQGGVGVSPQQGPLAMQQCLGLVAQPAKHHPLSVEQEPVEALSDSMEGDFVVVYNTSNDSSRKYSNSNSSSSKASSGLVDPKAAAVLQLPAASLAPQAVSWSPLGGSQRQQHPYHQRQQQPSAQHAAGAWPPGFAHCSEQQRQQQGVQVMHAHLMGAHLGPSDSHSSAVGGSAWPYMPAHSHLAPSIAGQSSVFVQPTSAQRVQLLVQLVRSCASLLAKQASGANDTVLPAVQQSEHLALMLLALQLVQVFCTPQLGVQHQQHEAQLNAFGSKMCDSGVSNGASLTDLLAAASQTDLEQLMSAAVELLALTKAIPGWAGSAAGDSERPHERACDHAAFARMTLSLLQLPLPDPFVVLYQQALDSCRGAAVEEVMGNWQASIAGYSLAADLLLFLSCEWQQLGAADPGLGADERHELHALYRAVNGRLAAVLAETTPSIVY